MSGERVPQRVRMDRALRRGVPRPGAQPAPDVGRGEAPAGLGEEESGLAGAGVERGAGTLQVAGDGTQSVLADGHEAGLAALPLDADLLGVEVDRAGVEVDQLLRAQAARVGELEQRAIALLERRRDRN